MEPPEGTTSRSEARGTVPGLFGPRWLQLPGRHLTVTSGGLGRRARSLKRDGRGHASRVLSFWNHLPQTTGALWFLLHAKPAPVLGSRCMPKPPMLLLRSCLPAAPAACRPSSAAKSACCQGVSVPVNVPEGEKCGRAAMCSWMCRALLNLRGYLSQPSPRAVPSPRYFTHSNRGARACDWGQRPSCAAPAR